MTRVRPGCIFFDITQDITDPAIFRLFEGWASRDALDADFAANNFQDILGKLLRLRVLDRHGEMIFVSHIETLAPPSP